LLNKEFVRNQIKHHTGVRKPPCYNRN